MNLEKLQSWLAIIANIGVMAGLFLLIIELDQTRNQAASSTYQNRINAIDSSLQAQAVSDYLPEIYVKLEQNGLDALSPVEFFRLRQWEFARTIRINGQLSQYDRGFLDEESYEAATRVAVENLNLWRQLEIPLDSGALQRLVENERQN